MSKEKTIKYDVDGQAIVWFEIDPATLQGEQLKLWQAYKDQYKTASETRAKFETAMRKEAQLPPGRRLVVGYNFGKLSVSNLVDDGGGNKTSKKAVSLKAALAG